ncbi:hypothetical protein FJ527_26920 [Mesorhizobium sp. B2-4-18]|uniref:hypothetical protein n=1 Tax=Mesorhizobium sp. B2-4-18 TaxID=2589931 RepID=UPI00112AFE9F|nr:hypothetical protein [Mesorhizobium sp. B2-4-18]TPK71267.1 hypothetical protein FJ527_26920 [Mesorhizobium sp. B2-4-18]
MAAMDVIIVTNTLHKDELGLLNRLSRETLTKNGVSVRSYGDLTDGWDLTWCHKSIIAREFIEENHGRYTHFIYLENDIRLSFLNFCYFVKYREALRGFGLLPSFIRVEYSTALGGFTSSDVFWPVYVPVQSHVLLGDMVLVNMPNPYNPLFILDLELGVEYVQSPSFDRQASRTVCRWGVAERAAMGLCLENVPAPFQSRYVTPIYQKTDTVPAFAWVWHMPNNYADNPRSALGKVRMDRMFVGAGELGQDGRWSTTDPVAIDVGDRDGGRSATAGRPDQSHHEKPAVADVDAVSVHASAVVENVQAFRDLYYLVTRHDTVMFVNDGSVCHAPFGVAPWNLVIELAAQKGRLLKREKSLGEVRQLSVGRSDSDMGHTDLDCDIENFSDGSIGVRTGDHYLGSDLDGVVRAKNWCRDWERYQLVRADTIEGLALLRRYSWLCHTDRQIYSLAAQPIDFGRELAAESSALAASLAPGAIAFRRKIAFGPVALKLTERRPQIVFEPCNPALGQIIPERLEILDSNTEAQSDFSLFRPLIHFSLGNENSELEKLRHSLDSLSREAGLGATICITSAQSATDLMQLVPEQYRSGALFLDAEMTGALVGILDFHPVVHADAGCTFGTDLKGDLIELLVSPKGELVLGSGLKAYASAQTI